MNIIKILCYDRIEVSEVIDVNKMNESKECGICQHWHFLNKGFKFQSYVYMGCHDLVMISINTNDIAILKIEGDDYCCIISRISKSEVINLMEIIDLTEKVEHYKTEMLLSHIKLSKEILAFGDIEIEKTKP